MGKSHLQHLRITLEFVENAVEPILLCLIRLTQTFEVGVLGMKLPADRRIVILELFLLVAAQTPGSG